jgi:hypothetical protein
MKSQAEIENLQLRTQLNIAIKGLNQIQYATEHVKRQPYDYGEAADATLYEIKNVALETKRNLAQAGIVNKHLKRLL